MEIEAATRRAMPGALDGATHEDDVFGTRPSRGRPHSMNLDATAQIASQLDAPRSFDLLVGVGIGAAIMYYLDPDGGTRRRAQFRDTIVRAVTAPPDGRRSGWWDLGGGASRALDEGGLPGQTDGRRGDIRQSTSTLGDHLIATVVGTALTLLAARRRDALGAAAGLVGSALLARRVVGR